MLKYNQLDIGKRGDYGRLCVSRRIAQSFVG